MTSLFGVVKGAATQASNPASSSQSKGLPRGVNLYELVSSCRQAGMGSCISLASTSRQPYHVESAVPLWRAKSRAGSDLETRCHVAPGREAVQNEDTASDSDLLAAQEEEGRKPLRIFSHFLRELTKQDVWSGFLDPFQTAGQNSDEVNYVIKELQLRNTSTFPSPSLNSATPDVVSQIAAVDEEQSTRSPRVNCYPDGNGALNLGTRIDVAESVSSAADTVLSSSIHTVTGSSSVANYAGMNGQILPSAPTSIPSGDSNGSTSAVEPAISRAASGHVLVDVPQAELCHTSATCVTAAHLGSVDNLAHWLEERIGSHIVSQWGSAPGTKHVSNLWCELVEGEISLEDSSPPKRSTHVTSVKIKNKEGHVLVEAYQEMADGRRRPRNRPLSEKMRPGEQVEEACLRGIFEELGSQMGARERVLMIPESYRREEEERVSFSYPGLPTRYVIHSMEAHIQQLPTTDFSTEEDESGHGSSAAGVEALNGSQSQKKAVGVKTHFWRWVPEDRLAELCKR